MSTNSQPGRIDHFPARELQPADADDRMVLRLSRESLRAEPPTVRFVDRLQTNTEHRRLPWPA